MFAFGKMERSKFFSKNHSTEQQIDYNHNQFQSFHHMEAPVNISSGILRILISWPQLSEKTNSFSDLLVILNNHKSNKWRAKNGKKDSKQTNRFCVTHFKSHYQCYSWLGNVLLPINHIVSLEHNLFQFFSASSSPFFSFFNSFPNT